MVGNKDLQIYCKEVETCKVWCDQIHDSQMNGVDAMPVRVKPEPQDSNASHPSSTNSTYGAVTFSQIPTSTVTYPSQQVENRLPALPTDMFPPSSNAGSLGVPPSIKGPSSDSLQKEEAETSLEDAIDYDSIRGIFGWATLDGINVPYIVRKYRKFVAVRIVEKKMLSRYPNSFPDELGKKEPLISYFVTEAEAKLLNEINTVHCSFEYGHQPFSTKDLIVDLVEFEDFYNLVKKTFPEEVLASMTGNGSIVGVDEKKVELSKMCGWIQINNTVTPYIIRQGGKYVPLSVIVYAAGLLTKDHVEGLLPTPEECNYLNASCQAAGFDFSFGKNTRLIHIGEVVERCHVRIFELPFENPLQHAQYLDSLQQSLAAAGSGLGSQSLPCSSQPSMVGSMSLPYRSMPFNNGPPNANPFGNYNPFVSMINMINQPNTSVNSTAKMNRQSPQCFQAPVCQGSQMPMHSSPHRFPQGPPGSVSMNVPMSPPSPLSSHSSNIGQSSMVGMHQGHAMPNGMTGFASSRLFGLAMRPGPGQSPHHGPLPGVHPGSRQPPPPYPPSFSHSHAHSVQHLGHPSATSGLPGSTSPHMLPPPHVSPTSEHHPGMFYPNMGSMHRGGVPMGYHPPSPIMSSCVHPSMPPPISGMPPPSAVSRTSPRSTGVSPIGERVSPAHQSPVIGHSIVQGREAALRLSSLAESPKVSSELHNRSRISSDSHLNLVSDITAVLVSGKSISCLVRNSIDRKGKFCLVEAVSKLYFPQIRLAEFVHALEHVLKINLPLCTEEEAKAFIHFYNLPVTTLNDNHMICLEDLTNFFPQMSYMFGQPEMSKALMIQAMTTRRSGPDSTMLKSPSTPITVVLSNNDQGETISIDSDSPNSDVVSPNQDHSVETNKKRTIAELDITEPTSSKQPCHRLEQMVQRLIEAPETTPDPQEGLSSRNSSSKPCDQSSSSGSVIVID